MAGLGLENVGALRSDHAREPNFQLVEPTDFKKACL